MRKYLGTNQDPLSHGGECYNRQIRDHFTCPACYKDLPEEEGIHTCSCGAIVECRNETPDYVDSVARMIPIDQLELYEDALEAAGIEVPTDAA